MEMGPYYSVKKLPLHELITHEFINTFVKKGKRKHLVSHRNKQNESYGKTSGKYWGSSCACKRARGG